MSGRAREGLIFRQDYFDDADGWAALKALLVDIFDVDVSPLDHLGGHDRTSFPSAYFDNDGRCIANLSAFSLPLVINGREVKACGWQSGAVRPDYRGRGLFQDLIRASLQHGEDRGYEATLLYTSKPGLYEPHGFRIVPQFRFVGVASRSKPHVPPARKLDLRSDLPLIRQALDSRTPVSRRLAVLRQSEMFLLNCHMMPDLSLSLLDTGAVIAWQISENGVFELMDIVGNDMPTMAEILAALDFAPVSITSFVPPDRLDWPCDAMPDDGDGVLMMRAPEELFPAEPGCLSPMAAF